MAARHHRRHRGRSHARGRCARTSRRGGWRRRVGRCGSRRHGRGRRVSPAAIDADELAHLEDQRDFLLASLADLEREHDAGDLDDADYAELRDDYTARAAETLRAVAQQRTAFADARRPRSLRRTLLVVGLVGAFAVVAGVAVAASVGARKPGGVSSGGVTTKEAPSQRAKACIAKMDRSGRNPKPAIDCFQAVMDEDPRNVVALAWLG